MSNIDDNEINDINIESDDTEGHPRRYLSDEIEHDKPEVPSTRITPPDEADEDDTEGHPFRRG